MNRVKSSRAMTLPGVRGWGRWAQHPAAPMAALGAVSGLLGTYLPGPEAHIDSGGAPDLGLYMTFTGVWFGSVIGFGLWRSGIGDPLPLAAVVLSTWAAWEIAVNLAMQIVGPAGPSASNAYYAAGIAAGAVGALLTWAGAAAWARPLRRPRAAAAITLAGALFGLLLPWSSSADLPAVLFVPWQAAVAALLGFFLGPRGEKPQRA